MTLQIIKGSFYGIIFTYLYTWVLAPVLSIFPALQPYTAALSGALWQLRTSFLDPLMGTVFSQKTAATLASTATTANTYAPQIVAGLPSLTTMIFVGALAYTFVQGVQAEGYAGAWNTFTNGIASIFSTPKSTLNTIIAILVIILVTTVAKNGPETYLNSEGMPILLGLFVIIFIGVAVWRKALDLLMAVLIGAIAIGGGGLGAIVYFSTTAPEQTMLYADRPIVGPIIKAIIPLSQSIPENFRGLTATIILLVVVVLASTALNGKKYGNGIGNGK